MNLVQLETIIRQAGGRAFALDYAEALLAKVNRVANHQVPANYLTQFSRSGNEGDLRGRLLEINLINCFAESKVPLTYEVKQGNTSGDIDLLWGLGGINVYIEVKLLRVAQEIRSSFDAQLVASGISAGHVGDEIYDVMRLQYTLIDEATTVKFQYPPLANNINLIAIDVSELQLGTVDAADCILATLGSEQVSNYFSHFCARSEVLGLFEIESTLEQSYWAHLINRKIASSPHPRDYIHGVIFLFRDPKESAALSYSLRACIAWNTNLINKDLATQINTNFHKIVPFYTG